MKMRRFLSCMVAAMTAMLCLSFQIAFAADTEEETTVSVWDGTYDTSWYDEGKTEFHIKTASEFVGISTLFNYYETPCKGKTFYLDSDLDFAINSIRSFPSFDGFFDGQGHSINNLHINGTGLFVEISGEIRNLIFNNISVAHYLAPNLGECKTWETSEQEYSYRWNCDIGVICSSLSGKIKNCSIRNGEIKITIKPSLDYMYHAFVVDKFNPYKYYNIKRSVTNIIKLSEDCAIGGICAVASHGIVEGCTVDINIEVFYLKPDPGLAERHDTYHDESISYEFMMEWELITGSRKIYSGIVGSCSNNSIISFCETVGFHITHSGVENYDYTSGGNRVGICGKCDNSVILFCATKHSLSDIALDDPGYYLNCGICGGAYSSSLVGNVYYGKNVIQRAGICSWLSNDCYMAYCYTNVENKTAGLECKRGIGLAYYDPPAHIAFSRIHSVYNTCQASSGVGLDEYYNERSQCFYLDSASSKDQTSSGVEKKTESEMKSQEFAESLGYPFVYVEGDYPKLAWELGEEIIWGDVNLDGTVDATDIFELQKHLLTEIELSKKAAFLADLNYDGKLNAVDLTLLKRIIM